MKPGNRSNDLDRMETKDLKVLALFTSVYCREHHGGVKLPLDAVALGMAGASLSRYRVCEECREFLAYAIERRLRCPLDPKPTCKHCQIHCFRSGHRDKVREIMRFSGKHLMRRGRLDLLWRYFF